MFVDGDVLVDVIQQHGALDQEVAGLDNRNGRFLLIIKLISHLSDHLFDQVFEGYQAQGSAVLIDDDGHMLVLSPECGQQLTDWQHLGHKKGFTQQRTQMVRFLGELLAYKVLDV